MAYSFPLAAADFLDLLPIKSISFGLSEAVELSKTGAGEILTSRLGSRLWQGKVSLDVLLPDEEDDVMAMLDIAQRDGASFLVHDLKRPWPRADAGGAAVAQTTPWLDGVSADTRSVQIAGLPAGYQINRGAWLAFEYGANPLRYALHRVAAAVMANGQGVTGMVEISPNIRPGWSGGTAVSLVRAACKALIVPGTLEPGNRSRLTTGVSFAWVQTLR